MPQKWIWEPSPDAIAQANVTRMMKRLGLATREQFLAYSRESLEEFWREMVQQTGIEWFHPYQQVLDTSDGVEWSRWFLGGRLNIVHNCVDRHRFSTREAIVWEGEDGSTRSLTFSELYLQVNRLANGMKAMGVAAGDRVALCMPMIPEVAVAMYACLKIGAIVVPIFAGFGAGAIATRLADSGAKLVFTEDSLNRRGKSIPLKAKVDEAITKTHSAIRAVTVRERSFGQPDECPTEPLDSEAPAFLLYTSGTTGKPKGTIHTHAGTLAQMSKELYLAFDHKPDDRFCWLSDIGWMMGPWTLIGNHHFGGTVVMYDGAPDFPTPNRLWQLIETHAITTFGISPTAIRLLMKTSTPEDYPLNTLRLLGSTGEPWDETSYQWFFEQIGKRRCPIINISGGTEIVGCFLFPLPIQKLKACSLGAPAPGIATEVVDEAGVPVRGRTGYLVCTKPAPSMTRGIWGDPERYIETYWSRWKGMWYHGDWASVDEDGCWFLHGRADESMNVAGRKVGPAEVEDTLMEHPAVSEAAVIGIPDALKGEGIVAFVVLKTPATPAELSSHLVANLGPTFRPNAVHAIPELPKTQSGKIVRRLIRSRYLGEPAGDTSTVSNPAALDAITPMLHSEDT